MPTPLDPDELYPAGHPDIITGSVRLSTGVTVRVAECGPPGGTPVLMLHGWGASLYTWRDAFRLLTTFGIRVIALDLRGYGLSDRPSGRDAYSLDAYCADVDALYAAFNLSSAALVGHSMGGAIALRYALRNSARVRRLALINPAGLVPIVYPLVVRLLPRALTRSVGERIVSRSLIAFVLRRIAYGDPVLVTERNVDEYWAPTQLRGFGMAAAASLRDFDWSPVTDVEAASLEPPAVVVLGRHDRLFRNSRARAERLNRVQVHQLDGGHCVHECRPDDVYSILGPFLR